MEIAFLRFRCQTLTDLFTLQCNLFTLTCLQRFISFINDFYLVLLKSSRNLHFTKSHLRLRFSHFQIAFHLSTFIAQRESLSKENEESSIYHVNS